MAKIKIHKDGNLINEIKEYDGNGNAMNLNNINTNSSNIRINLIREENDNFEQEE